MTAPGRTIALLIATLLMCAAPAAADVKGWPGAVKEIQYKSAADESMQPALLYAPDKKGARPLLVALHTWSGDYKQAGGQTKYARWCIEKDWIFIHPNFRGPNWTPEALGSELVVQDITSAVDHVKKNYEVDASRIYLVGVSGGGHAALLMAGRSPEIWAGVSAWCGISDVRRWWEQKTSGGKYAKHIEKACGGRPDNNPKAAEECRKRSPLTWLANARSVNLDINAGVKDGRKGSVPFTHSLAAFNIVAEEKDRIALKDIESFYSTMQVPAALKKGPEDPLYGSKRAIFRRTSGNTRITIFDGGHEIIHAAALTWLSKQRKQEKK
jgi:hypothetical protein